MIDYNQFFDVDKRVISILDKAEKTALSYYDDIQDISSFNHCKVLRAFQKNRVSDTHFAASTGYGYDDMGREALDRVYAELFGCEDALVRHNIISGTHALSLCFFGVLRPGDTLISVTGKPYDTLEETIGIRGEGNGSLRDFGVNYRQVDLKDGAPNYEGIKKTVTKDTKAVLIQRSKGYNFRPSLSVRTIERLIKTVKAISPNIIVIVDNCYGELVQRIEPTEVGADLIAGSLIKNPGGSIAHTGGYIAGRKDLVDLCGYKLNAVGIGKEAGPTLGMLRSMYQGLYFAPSVVAQALKTAVLASVVFSDLGFLVSPAPGEERSCIIESIAFENKERVIAFCEGIQRGAAIDSHVTPVPWAMPGYDAEVIMAAGAFHQGSSIELSADAPIKPPFAAYMQGGVTYDYGKLGIMLALDTLIKKNLC